MSVMADLLSKTLIRGDHVRSFHVAWSSVDGWKASEAADQHVVRHQVHQDWHHVERVIDQFHDRIAELQRDGWHDR